MHSTLVQFSFNITEIQTMFSDFQPVSHQQWKDKISQELKERDFSEIISRTDENFDILPFYQKADVPLANANCFLHNKEYFYPQNIWKLFLAMNNNTSIPAGQNLQLILDDFQGNEGISVKDDLDSLLQNVNVENSDVCFISGLQAIAIIELIKKYNEKHGVMIRGNIDNDPIINLFIRGVVASKEDMIRCKNVITRCTENFMGLSIQGQNFPELGANKVQELAFTFAAAIEYCDQLTDLGLSYETIVGNMQFCFGISGNYFLEIAKLRAAKLLWANIASQLNMSQTFPILIHGKTSMYNKSLQDNHTNIIRTTIEAMAAVSGGCHALTIYPYDYPTSSVQGVRIAKNIHHILHEEAFFDQCLNAASGAYYIEQLTEQFVNSAWKLIQQVEEKGGFSRATDFIRESIAQQRQKKQQDVAQKKVIFVGVNKYQTEDHAAVTPPPSSTTTSQSTTQELDNPLLTAEQVKEALEVHGYNAIAKSLCCAHPIEKALAKYTPTVLAE